MSADESQQALIEKTESGQRSIYQERDALLSGDEYSEPQDHDAADEAAGRDDGPVPRGHGSTRLRCSFRAWLLFCLFSLVLVAGLTYFLGNGKKRPVYKPTKHNDYILDPDWDFDAAPARREYQFRISDETLNPDGIYRRMMVINRNFPGPLIECNEGDTIVVHVSNRAENATSLHWHGLFQNGTNFMDGTVGVTQCPIGPGRDFTYEFKVQRQSGTYFYHGHHGPQAADGLVGPLVVHSKDEKTLQKLEYASDRVVMVQDHYHDVTGSLLMRYLAPDRENIEPVPDGGLINGRHLRDCGQVTGRKCDNSSSERPLFELEKNRNHRLRFVNVGAFAEFQISIDNHEFAVTEVDGTDTLPSWYHRLTVNPGQRYSVVLSANVTTADAFWLRAKMITLCFRDENPNMDPEVAGIIRYTGRRASTQDQKALLPPTSADWDEGIEVECKDLNTTELVPARAESAPEKADQFFYLYNNFEIGAWRLSRGFFNKTSWRANVHSPLLSRSINGLSSNNTSYNLDSSHKTAAVNDQAFNTSRELVIQTQGIQVIDLVLQNLDDGDHPTHLHGHKFWVLAQGVGFFNASEVYPTLDLANPLRRDTASLIAFGWLLIRFVADNPGVWAFHCHIAWHTEAGLLMSFLERADVVKDMVLPEANRGLCNAKGLEKGLGPKDDIWFGNKGG